MTATKTAIAANIDILASVLEGASKIAAEAKEAAAILTATLALHRLNR